MSIDINCVALPTESDPVLIDIHGAAKLLSVCSRTIQTLAAERGLPSVRIGRRLLFRPESLRQWAAEQEQR